MTQHPVDDPFTLPDTGHPLAARPDDWRYAHPTPAEHPRRYACWRRDGVWYENPHAPTVCRRIHPGEEVDAPLPGTPRLWRGHRVDVFERYQRTGWPAATGRVMEVIHDDGHPVALVLDTSDGALTFPWEAVRALRDAPIPEPIG